MKSCIMITLILSLKLLTVDSASYDYNPDECYEEIITTCYGDKPPDFSRCNSKYGAIERMEDLLASYASDQLESSYVYLAQATYFNSYTGDRPGFAKLFRLLCDRAFENAILLVEYITKRGGNANLYPSFRNASRTRIRKSVDPSELAALGKALDNEKKLSNTAIDIHHRLQRGSRTSIGSKSSIGYDPNINQFLEEHFLGQQSEIVRELSGYVTNLWKIMDDREGDAAMGLHLFDEHLWKQVEKFKRT